MHRQVPEQLHHHVHSMPDLLVQQAAEADCAVHTRGGVHLFIAVSTQRDPHDETDEVNERKWVTNAF